MESHARRSSEEGDDVLEELSALPDMTTSQFMDSGTRISWSRELSQALLLTQDQTIRSPARKVIAVIQNMEDNFGPTDAPFVAMKYAFVALKELKSSWIRLQDLNITARTRRILSHDVITRTQQIDTATDRYRKLLPPESQKPFDRMAVRKENSSQESSDLMEIPETDSEPDDSPGSTYNNGTAIINHQGNIDVLYSTPSPDSTSTPATSPATPSRLRRNANFFATSPLRAHPEPHAKDDRSMKEFASSKDDPNPGVVVVRGDESDYDTSSSDNARQRMDYLLNGLQATRDTLAKDVQNNSNALTLIYGQLSRMRDKCIDDATCQRCDLDILLEVRDALRQWQEQVLSTPKLNVCVMDIMLEVEKYLSLTYRIPITSSTTRVDRADHGLDEHVTNQVDLLRNHLTDFRTKSGVSSAASAVSQLEAGDIQPSPIQFYADRNAFPSGTEQLQAQEDGVAGEGCASDSTFPGGSVPAHAPSSELAVMLFEFGDGGK